MVSPVPPPSSGILDDFDELPLIPRRKGPAAPPLNPWLPIEALKQIDGSLRLECKRCGHQAVVPVADAASRVSDSETVADLLGRMRCRRCRQRGSVSARVV